MREDESRLSLFRGSGSVFAARLFERCGALQVAEKVLCQERLGLSEVRRLARLPLPFLAKLIELRFPDRALSSPLIRPLTVIPLASLIETKGLLSARRQAAERIQCLDENLSFHCPVYLAIDRWHGQFSADELLDTLAQIVGDDSMKHRFIPFGPSTGELKQIFGAATPTKPLENPGEEFFAGLRRVGVSAIEGGGDLELHSLAARHGLNVCIGQLIPSSDSRNEIDTANREFTRDIRWIDGFLQRIFSLSDRILPLGRCLAWFPRSASRLDSPAQETDSALGLQLLVAIALGRLLMPEVPHIRAPLAIFGIKAAHLALFFGANDLGFAAVDADTATTLGLPRFTEVENIFSRHAGPHTIVNAE